MVYIASMDRAVAVKHVETAIDSLETEVLPVPVRELWVFGDLALGLDPIDRLDLYLTKDILLGGSPEAAEQLEEEFEVSGLGTVVRAEWAETHPQHIVTNAKGYVAPEKCLASQLLPDGEPIHLEVCNSGFEDNVMQRLQAASEREAYEQLLDPRAVLVWRDGETADESLDRLQAGDFVFPTLAESLTMLGLTTDEAKTAAKELDRWRADLEGNSVRGEVV